MAGTAVDKNQKLEYQHTLIQSGGHTSTTWVLLNNQSTVEVFSNRRLLKNIRKSDRELAIFSTGGRKNKILQGDLPGYGIVWFRSGGITNILSLSKVAEKYRVSYSSTGDNKFLVYLSRGEVRSFTQCERVLFYYNMNVEEGTVLLNTLDHNKSRYSKRDHTRSLLAR